MKTIKVISLIILLLISIVIKTSKFISNYFSTIFKTEKPSKGPFLYFSNLTENHLYNQFCLFNEYSELSTCGINPFISHDKSDVCNTFIGMGVNNNKFGYKIDETGSHSLLIYLLLSGDTASIYSYTPIDTSIPFGSNYYYTFPDYQDRTDINYSASSRFQNKSIEY